MEARGALAHWHVGHARKFVPIHTFDPSGGKQHQNDDDSRKKRNNLWMLGARNPRFFGGKERRKVSIEVVNIAEVCKSQDHLYPGRVDHDNR